jgi:hypothetical protein
MRAFHLVGFRTVEGVAPRLLNPSPSPLFLPWWIPALDREIIVAFYQQVLSEGVLPRIEVNWEPSGLDATERDFLRSMRARHGSTEFLVVVKIRKEGADLQEIIAQPELNAFQHLAVLSEFPLVQNATFGRLRELCALVASATEDRYRELAQELSLPHHDGALLEPIVQAVLNPIWILEAYNDFLKLQHSGETEELFEKTLALSMRIFSTSLGVVTNLLIEEMVEGRPTWVNRTEEEQERILLLLRDAMLLRDGKLVGWAGLLNSSNLREFIHGNVLHMSSVFNPSNSMEALRSKISRPGDQVESDLPSNLDRGETSPPGPLPIDGEGDESVPHRDGVGVRFPVEVRREAVVSKPTRRRRSKRSR